MNVGMCGIGRLGLPVALAIENYGQHNVFVYDVNSAQKDLILSKDPAALQNEQGAGMLLRDNKLHWCDTSFDLVANSDIIFCAIQTPHNEKFEGHKPMPTDDRADFNYEYLKSGVHELALAALWQKKEVTLVVISTVLPGTMEREIYPLLNEYTKFVYNPFFIAMGTVVKDFMYPEFVLIGTDDPESEQVKTLRKFYWTIHNAKHAVMSVKSAELTKVSYNLYITTKINIANTIMEISEKTGANCDDVSNALALGKERILNRRYMFGGMGDGGACHPRDNIAMSWLAREIGLSHDVYTDLMKTREDQTRWLAQYVRKVVKSDARDVAFIRDYKPIVVLGQAFKGGTNITTGSAAVLLLEYLKEYQQPRPIEVVDPYVNAPGYLTIDQITTPSVFVVATNHPEFEHYTFPKGSIVVDPWGMMPDQDGVKVIRVGRN